MNPLLLILHPRRITETIEAFDQLTIDKAWLTGYTERELVPIIADLVATTDYSHYIAISDDAIVKQHALDAITHTLEQGHPVATGWCNLDATDTRVNLARSPLLRPVPDAQAYNLYIWSEVMSAGPLLPTWFAGMCLTGMTRNLWQRYPFDCYGTPGNASDYHLCWRLQQDHIPILAARDAFAYHLKEQWNYGDRAPDRAMHLGPQHQAVRLQHGHDQGTTRHLHRLAPA